MSESTAVLSAAEEVALARAIEAGVLAQAQLLDEVPGASPAELRAVAAIGREAWRRFLLANVRLVQSIAAHESRRSASGIDELFQEGFLGLADALLRWDHTAGFRFSTYATQWVRRRVQNAAVDRWLPTSTRTALRSRGVRALADRLSAQAFRRVTDREVAELVGRPERWVARMRGLKAVTPLIPELVAEPSDEPGGESELKAVLPNLPQVEGQVVSLRFGLGGQPALGQRVAAERLGVSLSTLRRYEARALRRLRGWLTAEQAA